MADIIGLPGSSVPDQETVFTYQLEYDTGSGVETQILMGDAIFTATMVGIINDEQILQFAVPITNLVSLKLVEATEKSVVQ